MSRLLRTRAKLVGRLSHLSRRKRRALLCLMTCLVSLIIYIPLSLRISHRWQISIYDRSIAHLPLPKVFIAALIADCAPLLRAHWIPATLTLIDKLGPRNVYVSILENDSLDDTRDVLRDFEYTLSEKGVRHTFLFEERVRDGYTMKTDGFLRRVLGEEGSNDNWIMTPNGWAPRRINYLAKLRNIVLEPIRTSTQKFDKVLFLNDVIYEV
jgi:hypothetical protein